MHMTNARWFIDGTKVAGAAQLEQGLILNDFEAQAPRPTDGTGGLGAPDRRCPQHAGWISSGAGSRHGPRSFGVDRGQRPAFRIGQRGRARRFRSRRCRGGRDLAAHPDDAARSHLCRDGVLRTRPAAPAQGPFHRARACRARLRREGAREASPRRPSRRRRRHGTPVLAPRRAFCRRHDHVVPGDRRRHVLRRRLAPPHRPARSRRLPRPLRRQVAFRRAAAQGADAHHHDRRCPYSPASARSPPSPTATSSIGSTAPGYRGVPSPETGQGRMRPYR